MTIIAPVSSPSTLRTAGTPLSKGGGTKYFADILSSTQTAKHAAANAPVTSYGTTSAERWAAAHPSVQVQLEQSLPQPPTYLELLPQLNAAARSLEDTHIAKLHDDMWTAIAARNDYAALIRQPDGKPNTAYVSNGRTTPEYNAEFERLSQVAAAAKEANMNAGSPQGASEFSAEGLYKGYLTYYRKSMAEIVASGGQFPQAAPSLADFVNTLS